MVWFLYFSFNLYKIFKVHKFLLDFLFADLFDFSASKLKQIAWGYECLSHSIFGNNTPVAIGLFLMFGCIIGGGILLYKHKEKRLLIGFLLVVLTAQAYQLIVCFTLPAEWEERYLWSAFTLMMFCMAWGALLLLQFIFSKIKAEKVRRLTVLFSAFALSVIIFVGELLVIDKGRGIAYLFQEGKDVTVLQSYKDIPWVVYGPTGGAYSYYDWLIPNEICFLTTDDTIEDRIAIQQLRGRDSFILYLLKEYSPHALELFEEELGRKLDGQYLFNSTKLSVYLVK